MLNLKNVKRIIDIRTVTLKDKAKEVFGCAMADFTADGQVMIAGPMPPHVLTNDEEHTFRKALREDGYLLYGDNQEPNGDEAELPLATATTEPEPAPKAGKSNR